MAGKANDARTLALEMLANTEVTNLTFMQGAVTKSPDWAVYRNEDGEWTLGGEFVQFTVALGAGYETVRCFDEALMDWALGLGGGSVVQVVCERVNKPKGQGQGWSTYWLVLAVNAVSTEPRDEGIDREGAVERRIAAEKAGAAGRRKVVILG